MLGVFADNHDFAFSLYDFALIAYLFNGWFNLHFIIPYLSSLILRLFRTPGYAALGQVIDRNLYGHLIARQYSNIIHSKLTRNVSRYYMAVGKLYLEGRVRQCLNYCTLKFNYVILWQNNPSSAFICDFRLFPTLTTLCRGA